MQTVFSLHLSGGYLKHGEKRTVKIILNNETYEVILTSVNFNQKNYPDHKDMWQILYAQNGSFANTLKNIFSSSYSFFAEVRESKNPKKKILPEKKEFIVLYTTNLKDTFFMDTIFAGQLLRLKEVGACPYLNRSLPDARFKR
ncbi:MAG: hypothetical protein IJU91_07410 [Selenomonadaceae bacterium]|nr:hypothetical protein [Selenomonadaceae bacterium]